MLKKIWCIGLMLHTVCMFGMDWKDVVKGKSVQGECNLTAALVLASVACHYTSRALFDSIPTKVRNEMFPYRAALLSSAALRTTSFACGLAAAKKGYDVYALSYQEKVAIRFEDDEE